MLSPLGEARRRISSSSMSGLVRSDDTASMFRIRLSDNLRQSLLRQTPGGHGVWEGHVFLPAGVDSRDRADYWVVYEGLERREEVFVAPSHVIFVAAEPEAWHTYAPDFLAQFGLVITTQRRVRGPNVIHMQPGLPWHVGVARRDSRGASQKVDPVCMGYDEFRTARVEKTQGLSVVCSDKSQMPGHRRRLAFVSELKEHFGERLHWFGRGVQPVEDKWDAVAPYSFHISLENSEAPDYWTEKLADAYLAGAFPFYWGCPNIHEYFDPNAFSRIDIDDLPSAIAVIERALEEGLTPLRKEAIAVARNQVLDRYNLFPMIVSNLQRCADGEPQMVRLRPEEDFLPRWLRWRHAAARKLVRVS